MNRRYREVNLVFLITTLVVLGASFLPLGKMFPNYAMIFVVSQLMIMFPTLGYLIWSKQKYTEAVGINKVSLSNVVLTIAFAFCMMRVMNFINAISMTFAKNVIQNEVGVAAEQNPFIITLICVAVLPAFFEESIYRGVFYHEYRKVNPLGAVFLSAFLFGLLHGNLNQFSYAFSMGIILALLVEATDSLIPTMIAHFIVNGTAVVLMYSLPAIQKIEASYGLDIQTVDNYNLSLGDILRILGPGTIVFGIGGFFLFRTIAKNCGRWEHVKGLFKKDSNKPSQHLFTIPLIVTIIFWIIIMIAGEVMPS